MKRALLIDWDPGSAAEHAAAMQQHGWTTEIESSDGARALKHVRDNMPDVVVVDLGRLASHGREAARAIRTSKGLASIPIVFVGGTDEARAKAAAAVPGAIVAERQDLMAALARSLMRTV